MTTSTISIIVAMSANQVIGRGGNIPWGLATDLKRFRKLTFGHPVIMGRRTYESIAKKTEHTPPLQGRTNIVVSRNLDFKAEGCVVTSSFENALELAQEAPGAEEIFIVGGDTIYKDALPHTTRICRTTVHTGDSIEGDVYFTAVEGSDWETWEVTSCEHVPASEFNNFSSTFEILERGVTNFMNFAHARTPDQRAQMEQIVRDGVCPFCREHLEKYHNSPILRESEWWVVTLNDHPYEGSRLHALLIYKEHVEQLSEIHPQAFSDLLDLLKWLEHEYSMSGGTFFIRFGDSEYTGASVTHLHAHIVVGAKRAPGCEKIRTPIGYKVS